MLGLKVYHKAVSSKTEITSKYTGLEHRQTLRACDFHCNLQIETENENIDK